MKHQVLKAEMQFLLDLTQELSPKIKKNKQYLAGPANHRARFTLIKGEKTKINLLSMNYNSSVSTESNHRSPWLPCVRWIPFLSVFLGADIWAKHPPPPASARRWHMADCASFSECLVEAASSQPASTARKEDIHQDRCNLPCSHASLLIQFVNQLLNVYSHASVCVWGSVCECVWMHKMTLWFCFFLLHFLWTLNNL